jgi:predicted AAA+ superfamily ATPase
METLILLVRRIAEALERASPAPAARLSLDGADAFVWRPQPHGQGGTLDSVAHVARVDIGLLQGIDQPLRTLLDNTLRFAAGKPANNAMLWGARGMGKSSLVKAVHAEALARMPGSLALIEIRREDIATLPLLLGQLRAQPRRVLIFCDDLSFEREDADYKALKSVLEGGIEGRPENVLLYATSNRRHLMPRDMMENEAATAISPGEATEEKVSLSDRFGLWLGFHSCDQPTYLRIVAAYADHYKLQTEASVLASQALAWAMARGARSGRVAFQFIQDQLGKT